MIYQIKHTTQEKAITYTVDDTIFFADQPKNFQKAFNELKKGEMAEFDNAVAYQNGQRVLITMKENSDEI